MTAHITTPADLASWDMAPYVAGREPDVLRALYARSPDDFEALVVTAETFGPRAMHYELGLLAPSFGVTDPLAGTTLSGPSGDAARREEQAAWERAKGYDTSGMKAFSPEGYEPDVPVQLDTGMMDKAFDAKSAAPPAGGTASGISSSDVALGLLLGGIVGLILLD
jgi:hypothetical protein